MGQWLTGRLGPAVGTFPKGHLRDEFTSGVHLNEGLPWQREFGEQGSVHPPVDHRTASPPSVPAVLPTPQTRPLASADGCSHPIQKSDWPGGHCWVTQDSLTFWGVLLFCHHLQAWDIEGQSLRAGRGLVGLLASSPPCTEQETEAGRWGSSQDQSHPPGAGQVPRPPGGQRRHPIPPPPLPSRLIPCHPNHLISSHPTSSHPLPSYPIPSHPLPSHPIPSHLISSPLHPSSSCLAS